MITAIIFILANRNVVEAPAGKPALKSERANEGKQVMENDVPETGTGILPHSIAILPLKNLSPDSKDANMATALHQEIIRQMAKIQDLNVIASNSVLDPTYASGSMSISAIASDLNVATIMTGSVHFAGDIVSVTVQLFNGENGAPLWSDSYQGNLINFPVFQSEIAQHITNASRIELPVEVISSMTKPGTRSPEAYTLYLKARALAPDTSSRLPLEYYQDLEQAITIDPYFALAHAAMAYGLGSSLTYGIPVNGYSFQTMERIALSHIAIVMETDPSADMVYMAQAFIHWSHQRGTPALQAFERALQLSPNNVEIMDDYSRFLSFIGEHDAAVSLARHAATLSPRDPASHYLLGLNLVFAGNPAAAEKSVRRAIILAPSISDSHLLLGEIELRMGNNDVARAELERSEQLADLDALTLEEMAILIHAYSRLGLKDNVHRVFDHFNARVASGDYASTSALALAYLAIGNANVTFDLLNRDPNEGIEVLQRIKTNILNDPVLETSRFLELRRRIARLTGGVSNLNTPPF